jgi:O-antigen ligase
VLANRLNTILKRKWGITAVFYIVVLAFILFNGYLVLKKDTNFGAAIPLAAVVVLAAIFSYEKLIWLVVLFTPLSVELRQIMPGLPIDMYLPTEPILVTILLLFFIAFIGGKRLDRSITNHPVSWVLYFYLGWMILTTTTSTLPLVSIKMLLTRIWFIVVFYFLMAFLIKEDKNKSRFIWLYLIAFVPVILYTIIRHTGYGLMSQKAAHFVMTPFFNDHTSYGAALAFFIPVLLGFVFSDWLSKKHRIIAGGILFLFIVALILSYTRAAWLSLMVGFGVWLIIKLRIQFKKILLVVLVVFASIFAFQDQILMALEKNSQDSSGDLFEHFSSMTNITTDASNLERINRWHCAINMFQEKPFLGWGPGTYAMQYGPFQLKRDRTIISTNYGDGGNAHSEYLGALAESGVLGMISFLMIIIVVMYIGINAYSRTNDKKIKTLALSAIIGLITYYFHGILNNFLDTDKISLPFWGFTALLVIIDIQTKKELKNPSQSVHNGSDFLAGE